MPEITLPVTEEDYEKAVSKFITFPPDAKVGDIQVRKVELGMVDWDTPGKSLKWPVRVIEEGIDFGKEDKISSGVDQKGVWKTRQLYENITGTKMPMKEGADGKKHPSFDGMEFAGKQAYGVWTLMEGHSGGDPSAPVVKYSKLTDITSTPPGQVENL